jgi:dTMP kinase
LPDLTIILDLPPDMGLKRAAARRGRGQADRFEGEDLSFHEGLRKAFMAIAAGEPDRCIAIDATQSEEAVARDVWNAVDQKLRPARWIAVHGGEA